MARSNSSPLEETVESIRRGSIPWGYGGMQECEIAGKAGLALGADRRPLGTARAGETGVQ
jgi:hypothetical protein